MARSASPSLGSQARLLVRAVPVQEYCEGSNLAIGWLGNRNIPVSKLEHSPGIFSDPTTTADPPGPLEPGL